MSHASSTNAGREAAFELVIHCPMCGDLGLISTESVGRKGGGGDEFAWVRPFAGGYQARWGVRCFSCWHWFAGGMDMRRLPGEGAGYGAASPMQASGHGQGDQGRVYDRQDS